MGGRGNGNIGNGPMNANSEKTCVMLVSGVAAEWEITEKGISGQVKD